MQFKGIWNTDRRSVNGVQHFGNCFKMNQVSAKQAKYWGASADYVIVNEHFEPIFNAGLCRI